MRLLDFVDAGFDFNGNRRPLNECNRTAVISKIKLDIVALGGCLVRPFSLRNEQFMNCI